MWGVSKCPPGGAVKKHEYKHSELISICHRQVPTSKSLAGQLRGPWTSSSREETVGSQSVARHGKQGPTLSVGASTSQEWKAGGAPGTAPLLRARSGPVTAERQRERELRPRRGGRNAAGGPPGSRRTQFSRALASVPSPHRELAWPCGRTAGACNSPSTTSLPPEEPSQAVAPASVEIRGRSRLSVTASGACKENHLPQLSLRAGAGQPSRGRGEPGRTRWEPPLLPGDAEKAGHPGQPSSLLRLVNFSRTELPELVIGPDAPSVTGLPVGSEVAKWSLTRGWEGVGWPRAQSVCRSGGRTGASLRCNRRERNR